MFAAGGQTILHFQADRRAILDTSRAARRRSASGPATHKSSNPALHVHVVRLQIFVVPKSRMSTFSPFPSSIQGGRSAEEAATSAKRRAPSFEEGQSSKRTKVAEELRTQSSRCKSDNLDRESHGHSEGNVSTAPLSTDDGNEKSAQQFVIEISAERILYKKSLQRILRECEATISKLVEKNRAQLEQAKEAIHTAHKSAFETALKDKELEASRFKNECQRAFAKTLLEQAQSFKSVLEQKNLEHSMNLSKLKQEHEREKRIAKAEYDDLKNDNEANEMTMIRMEEAHRAEFGKYKEALHKAFEEVFRDVKIRKYEETLSMMKKQYLDQMRRLNTKCQELSKDLTDSNRKMRSIEEINRKLARQVGQSDATSRNDISIGPQASYDLHAPRRCNICFEKYNDGSNTISGEDDRRPVIMPGDCGRSICKSCAEKDRASKIEDLPGNVKMIQCMFCRCKYHSEKHVFVINRDLMALL